MYKIKKLPNNLRLIVAPIQGTKTVSVLAMVAAGSKYENKDNNGISHFLEHMFFKGTKKRPNTMAISGELDSLGAEFNAFTSKEYSGYWVKVDSAKTSRAMDIISDMLLNSKFSPAEINREKGVILEEVNMYHDNPMMYIEDVFENCLYGDAPAGWDTLGTKKNILNFRQSDFKKYLSSHYSADKIVVCLAGAVKPGHIKQAEKYFSRFHSFKADGKIPVQENNIKSDVKVHYKKTDQATFCLGSRTFPDNHPDKIIAGFLSVVLGGSMSSRLFINLRERNGLAYFVKTQAEFYTDSGYLATTAGVPVAQIEKAIKIILAEYQKIARFKISAQELKRNKDLVRGRVVIGLEPSDDTAIWYAKQSVLDRKVLTPEEYCHKIDQISAADLQRVAREIFLKRPSYLAVIGPFTDKNKFEKILAN